MEATGARRRQYIISYQFYFSSLEGSSEQMNGEQKIAVHYICIICAIVAEFIVLFLRQSLKSIPCQKVGLCIPLCMTTSHKILHNSEYCVQYLKHSDSQLVSEWWRNLPRALPAFWKTVPVKTGENRGACRTDRSAETPVEASEGGGYRLPQ